VRTRIDSRKLVPANNHYNASIIRWQGRLLLAYRTNWGGSSLHIAELSEDLIPLRNLSLRINHELCPGGREDPRFFVYQNRLHISFVGVEKTANETRCHMLYLRLFDNLHVERVFHPAYSMRQWPMEKNWVYFEHDGQLLAVYSIAPTHKILRIDGDTAYPFMETPFHPAWEGGHLRGGASPVRVGNEYFCWAHGRREGRPSVYCLGAYSFEAKPPFRPLRYTPTPLVWADERDKPPALNWTTVIYPSGCILENGKWLVSCGINDFASEVLAFDHSEVERVMVSA
jgi:predicted GH43/DUF377 family glycosyl hydrolase